MHLILFNMIVKVVPCNVTASLAVFLSLTFFFSYSSTLTGILASSCTLFFKLLCTGECSSLCWGRLIQFLCSATPIHPSNATSKVTSFLGSSLTATGSCTRSSELLRIVLSYPSGSQKEVLSPFFVS